MSKEKLFNQSEILLSTTTTDSHIKYANKNFCDIAGYTLEELKGNPHNMVRHPDMPKEAFKNLWSFIQAGKPWMGPVKNKCKNGDYYWVNAFVTPIKDSSGKVNEYQSVRTLPERDVIDRTIKVYSQLKENKQPSVLKYQTDITLWIQLILILLSALSAGSVLFSETNYFISLSMLLISLIGTAVFSFWRKKYKQVVNDAKAIYDNSLETMMILVRLI